MSHLFAAVLLFFSPGCPHEEPSCITPTEYVEVSLSPQALYGNRGTSDTGAPGRLTANVRYWHIADVTGLDPRAALLPKPKLCPTH